MYLNTFRFDGSINDRTCKSNCSGLVSSILMTLSDYSDMTDIWGHVEASASIIAACLPTMGPLLSDDISSLLSLRSIRNFFTINSSANRTYSENIDLTGRAGTWRAFAATNNNYSTRYKGSNRSNDANSLSKRTDAIVVDQSFGTYNEEPSRIV